MRILMLLMAAALLACCAATINERTHRAAAIAMEGRLEPLVVETPTFRLQAYVRLPHPVPHLVVYIEGDGFAWVSRNKKSSDPTPILPLALQLAALDPRPAVAYLARPCQYAGVGENPACTDDVWTRGRFSEEVVTSISQAIDRLKTAAGAKSVELIGYSGGGGVAILVAARRRDVDAVVTVAGNLDHRAFTDVAGVTPLDGSLNPLDVAEAVSSIPQIHFVGAEDRIVPEAVSRSFLARSRASRCIAVIVVPDTDHARG